MTDKIYKWLYVFSAATLVLILDRLTKYVITHILANGQSIKIIPNFFHITLVLNKGAAFGLFKEMTAIFVLLSLSVIIFIILYIWRNEFGRIYLPVALGLILGGAIGNLIDRIKFGYVIDFIDFRIWPVFNMADSCITIGAIILAWHVLTKK